MFEIVPPVGVRLRDAAKSVSFVPTWSRLVLGLTVTAVEPRLVPVTV